jgi:hypothetical protein
MPRTQVDLGARAVHGDGVDLSREIRLEVLASDQPEQGAFRVGPGHDAISVQNQPVGQNDTRGATVPDPDLLHRRAGDDLDAGFAAGGSHRPGHGAHAADHVSGIALALFFSATEKVEQQPHRGARIPRTAMFSIQVVGQDQPLDRLGVEVTIQQLLEAAAEEGDEFLDALPGQAAQAQAQPQGFQPAGQAGRPEVRRRFHEKRLQVTGQRLQVAVQFEERLGIAATVAAELGMGALLVTPPGQHGAVFEGDLDARVGGHHAQAVPAELHVADDLGPQHAGHVGGSRDPASGCAQRIDLFGHRAAADQVAALDDARCDTASCKVEGAGQRIVSSADDQGAGGLSRPGHAGGLRRAAGPSGDGAGLGRGAGRPAVIFAALWSIDRSSSGRPDSESQIV